MTLVYCVSNLNISNIPQVIKKQAIVSSFKMRVLLISSLNMAMKSVMEYRQTNVAETVETLIEAKNNNQWPPTKAPVSISFNNIFLSILMAFLWDFKYRNNEITVIITLYHTNFIASGG